jgi:hypothetical protein
VTDCAGIVAQRVGPASLPVPGRYVLFKNAVIQQARLLAIVDIFWCLTVLGAGGFVVALVTRQRLRAVACALRVSNLDCD